MSTYQEKITAIQKLVDADILTRDEYTRIDEVLKASSEGQKKLSPEELIYQECTCNTSKLLVAPATAVYPEYSPDMLETIDLDTAILSFYVDSQNKNGAFIRTKVKAKIVKGKYAGTAFLNTVIKPGFFSAKAVEEWSDFSLPT